MYISEDGYYTVELNDMDLFNYATCCVFAEFDGVSVYLGEDDNVDCDFDNMVIYDNFSGEWASLDGIPLAIELVCRNDTTSIYTCPILLNGEDYIENDEQYTVNGEIEIEFEPLGNGFFSYSMILYDVFGNYYFTNTAAVSVDENGCVRFSFNSF